MTKYVALLSRRKKCTLYSKGKILAFSFQIHPHYHLVQSLHFANKKNLLSHWFFSMKPRNIFCCFQVSKFIWLLLKFSFMMLASNGEISMFWSLCKLFRKNLKEVFRKIQVLKHLRYALWSQFSVIVSQKVFWLRWFANSLPNTLFIIVMGISYSRC